MVAATAKKPSKKTQTATAEAPAVTPFDLPDDKGTAGAELQRAAPAVPATPAEAPAEPAAAPATPVADAGLTVGKIADRLEQKPLPEVIDWALAQEGATLYAAPLAAMVAQRSADAGKMTPAALAQLDAVIASLRDADATANAPVYQMIVDALRLVCPTLPLGGAPPVAAAARAKGPTKPKAPSADIDKRKAVELTPAEHSAYVVQVINVLRKIRDTEGKDAEPTTNRIAGLLTPKFTDITALLAGEVAAGKIIRGGAGRGTTYRLA